MEGGLETLPYGRMNYANLFCKFREISTFNMRILSFIFHLSFGTMVPYREPRFLWKGGMHMNVKERILTVRLIEKMHSVSSFGAEAGILVKTDSGQESPESGKE